MPNTNWHSARIKSPTAFIKDTIKTIVLKGVEGIHLVSGKLKKDGKGGPMVAQSYRFDRDIWSVKEAKKWMKDHKKTFTSFEVGEGTKEVKEMASSAASVGIRDPGVLGSGTSSRFDDFWDSQNKKKKKIFEQEVLLEAVKTGKRVTLILEDETRVTMEQGKVIATSEGNDFYGGFPGGYRWRERLVRDALKESKKYGDWQDILEIFDDKVYIGVYDNLKSTQRLFDVPYTLENEKVTLSEPSEMTRKTMLIKEQVKQLNQSLFLTETILDV